MKRLGSESLEDTRARGYAAKFEAEHPGESANDDVMAATFANCVVVPRSELYPAIRRQLEVIREAKTRLATPRAQQQPQVPHVTVLQRRTVVDVQLPSDDVVR